VFYSYREMYLAAAVVLASSSALAQQPTSAAKTAASSTSVAPSSTDPAEDADKDSGSSMQAIDVKELKGVVVNGASGRTI
jgi:hypothetical protein